MSAFAKQLTKDLMITGLLTVYVCAGAYVILMIEITKHV